MVPEIINKKRNTLTKLDAKQSLGNKKMWIMTKGDSKKYRIMQTKNPNKCSARQNVKMKRGKKVNQM